MFDFIFCPEVVFEKTFTVIYAHVKSPVCDVRTLDMKADELLELVWDAGR
jgi:hypothetical protein